MFRRATITLMIATGIVAAIAAITAAATPSASGGLAQDDTVEALQTAPVEQLVLGERYANGSWELEVQDAFVAASPDRHGYSEVRASVAYRITTSDVVLPYEWAGLSGEPGYPELWVVDAEGERWAIPLTEPANSSLPGSQLVSLEPYVPAHWTVGFEVPTAQASDLHIQALWNGAAVADWDILTDPVALQGWSPPPATTAASTGAFAWSDTVDLQILDHNTSACGDAGDANVTTGFAMSFSVSTTSTRDAVFPNVRYPEPTAIAIWDDGTTARSVPLNLTALAGSDAVPVNARNAEQVLVAPGTLVTGVADFFVPRDARFADPFEAPAAVVLYPPDRAPVWYEVSGPATLDLAVDSCDGIFGGPAFEVGR